jgi:hypothetical protein
MRITMSGGIPTLSGRGIAELNHCNGHGAFIKASSSAHSLRPADTPYPARAALGRCSRRHTPTL